MQWQERLRSLPLPLTLSYPMKDHHLISCSSGHGMKCSLNSLSHLEAARLDFKATADCRVLFSLSGGYCVLGVYIELPCVLNRCMGSEALNYKTEDLVYRGRSNSKRGKVIKQKRECQRAQAIGVPCTHTKGCRPRAGHWHRSGGNGR